MFQFLYITFFYTRQGRGMGDVSYCFFFLYVTLKEAKGWCIIALFKSENTLKVGYLLRQIRHFLTDSCRISLKEIPLMGSMNGT